MKLEQIDTSTTAGKAEVMRLAAEGRKVAYSNAGHHEWARAFDPYWDWRTWDYAIIAEPVGPEEVWATVYGDSPVVLVYHGCEVDAKRSAEGVHGTVAVRYVRADLAGEVKP